MKTHPSHKTRFSDASSYDEICEACGATDRRGCYDLEKPCPAVQRQDVVRHCFAPADLKPELDRVGCGPEADGRVLESAAYGAAVRHGITLEKIVSAKWDGRQVVVEALP